MSANRIMAVVFSVAVVLVSGSSYGKDKVPAGDRKTDKAPVVEKGPDVSVDKAYVDQVAAMNMEELKAELAKLGEELKSYNDSIQGQRQDFYQKRVTAANGNKTVKELQKQIEDLKARIEEVISGLPEVKGVADQIKKAQDDMVLCALKRKAVSARMSELEKAAASEPASQTNAASAVETGAKQ